MTLESAIAELEALDVERIADALDARLRKRLAIQPDLDIQGFIEAEWQALAGGILARHIGEGTAGDYLHQLDTTP